jgi:hypothetical protein
MPTATRIRDHCLAPGRAVDAPAPGGGYRPLALRTQQGAGPLLLHR